MAYVSSNQEDEEEKKKQSESLGGEVGAGNVGDGGGGPQPAPYTQTGFASAKNIFEKNKGAADQYDVTQPFQEDLNKSRSDLSGNFQKLQENLGKQVQGQKASDDDLAKGIAIGSGEGYQKIMQALRPNAVTGQLDPVQSRYNANDVTSLNTAPGIQAAIANQAEKKGVQNYTQGMGALDSAIYQANPQYRQKVADLSKKYSEYDKEKEDYSKQAASAVEKSNKELQDYSQSLRGQLSAKAQEARDSADIYKNQAARQRVIDRENAIRADAARQQQELFGKVGSSIQDQEARDRFLADSTKTGGLNLGDYFNINNTSNYDYSGEDAAKFNNIMALLGNNERVSTGNGVQSRFNSAGLENALRDRAGRIQQETSREREARIAAEALRQRVLQENQARNQQKADDKVNPVNVTPATGNKSPDPTGKVLDEASKRIIPKEIPVVDTDPDNWW